MRLSMPLIINTIISINCIISYMPNLTVNQFIFEVKLEDIHGQERYSNKFMPGSFTFHSKKVQVSHSQRIQIPNSFQCGLLQCSVDEYSLLVEIQKFLLEISNAVSLKLDSQMPNNFTTGGIEILMKQTWVPVKNCTPETWQSEKGPQETNKKNYYSSDSMCC